MPNIDNLIDIIQRNINTNASNETAFLYTGFEVRVKSINIDPETSRHCNFNKIIGECKGTYRFIAGFYGLTDMPAAFQKLMKYTLVGLKTHTLFP